MYSFYISGLYYLKAVAIYENRKFVDFLDSWLKFSKHNVLLYFPVNVMDPNDIKNDDSKMLFVKYMKLRFYYYYLFVIGNVLYVLFGILFFGKK